MLDRPVSIQEKKIELNKNYDILSLVYKPSH